MDGKFDNCAWNLDISIILWTPSGSSLLAVSHLRFVFVTCCVASPTRGFPQLEGCVAVQVLP